MYNMGMKTVKKLPDMLPDENCKRNSLVVSVEN